LLLLQLLALQRYGATTLWRCSSRHGNVLQCASLQRRCFATGGAALLCNDGGLRSLNEHVFFLLTNGGQVCTRETDRKKEKKRGALKLVKNLDFIGWHNTSSFL